MLCERTQKQRIFFIRKIQKEPSPVIYMGFCALPNQEFTGIGGSDWYVQSFPGACCSKFMEGSAYNKKMR